MLEKVEYFVYVFIFINAYIGLYTALKLNPHNMGILDCVEYACTGILQYFMYRKKQYKIEYKNTVDKLYSLNITNLSSKSLTELKSLATETISRNRNEKIKKDSSKAYTERVSNLVNKYHNVEK